MLQAVIFRLLKRKKSQLARSKGWQNEHCFFSCEKEYTGSAPRDQSPQFAKRRVASYFVYKGADNFSNNRNLHAQNNSLHAKTRNLINGVLFRFRQKDTCFSIEKANERNSKV
jgi:hypothetical protein